MKTSNENAAQTALDQFIMWVIAREEALSDEERQYAQSEVDRFHDEWVALSKL